MTRKEKKQVKYAAKMKRAGRNIRKKKSFIMMFIVRLSICLIVTGILGTVLFLNIRKRSLEELAYTNYDDKLYQNFIDYIKYREDGEYYLKNTAMNENEQWIASIKQLDVVLPLFLNETGYWGIYDYTNDKVMTEYSENTFEITLLFKGQKNAFKFSLIDEQKDDILPYMEDTGKNRLASKVYILSGFYKGTNFMIETMRIGEDGENESLPIGDVEGWEHFTIDIEDRTDVDSENYDKEKYWDGLSRNYGLAGDYQISSWKTLTNASIYVKTDYNKKAPMSGKLDEDLKAEAKKLLYDYIEEEDVKKEVLSQTVAYSSDEKIETGISYERNWMFAAIKDGDNIYGLIYTDLNERTELDACLIEIIVAVIVISIIIGYFGARVAFMKHKIRKDMYEYRTMVANTMAHDLKSPLMAISGYVDNMLENTNPEKNHYYLEEISKKTVYMSQLIENTLELSKSEELVVNKKEQLDITECIKEIQLAFAEQIVQKKLTVDIEGSKLLSCDKNAMITVVRNIFENAVKYSEENGNIDIELKDDRIVFKNTCKGLKTDVNKLFEAYIKDDSSRTGTKGNGLGVAIVKSICDAHGYLTEADYKDEIFTITIANI